MLGRGHRWWDRRWEDGNRPSRNHYFIFVEEAHAVNPERLLGPNELPISLDESVGNRPWRFRASGIRARDFLDSMHRIDELNHDAVLPDQRRTRRTQLAETFGDVPLPLLDLFVPEEDSELPFLRAMLIPGSWYWVAVVRRSDQDNRLPIFVDMPEGPMVGAMLPGSLRALEAVPPFLEYRLRDIFSLVHLSDAGEEDLGGEGPPPDKPQDGDAPLVQPLRYEEWQLEGRLLPKEQC